MLVKYALIPSGEIFNACHPALLHDVAVLYKGSWWDKEQDPLREMLGSYFIQRFDELTGHYSRLRESISRDGIKDPIVITAGNPIWRKPWMVPSDIGPYICESCGGSRLVIAAELGIDVPCIINDQIGVDGELIKNSQEVSQRFSGNYSIIYGPPVRVHPKSFSHMPNNYTFGDQQTCRRKVKAEMIALSKRWREANTRESGT